MMLKNYNLSKEEVSQWKARQDWRQGHVKGDVRAGTLLRQWDREKRQSVVIGHSPSTATDDKDDFTTMKLTKMCRMQGYGGYHLLNLSDPVDDTRKSIEQHED